MGVVGPPQDQTHRIAIPFDEACVPFANACRPIARQYATHVVDSDGYTLKRHGSTDRLGLQVTSHMA